MLGGRKSREEECALLAGEVEEAAFRLSPGSGEEVLKSKLSPEAQMHLAHCADCAGGVEDFIESARLLSAVRGSEASANPFFEKRVMAAIQAAELEQERSGRMWVLVPRLAARLAGLTAVALLIAASWVYENPAPKQVKQPTMDSGGQLFEDNSAVPSNQDDVLMSLLERPE